MPITLTNESIQKVFNGSVPSGGVTHDFGDVSGFWFKTIYVKNTGANPFTACVINITPNPADATPDLISINTTTFATLAAGEIKVLPISDFYRGIKITMTSALGTTAKVWMDVQE